MDGVFMAIERAALPKRVVPSDFSATPVVDPPHQAQTLPMSLLGSTTSI
jgi:hypothetical protein